MAWQSSRRRIWGWMFFDWAQQPYATLGLTFIFSPYFAAVAAEYFLGTGMAEDAAKAQAQGLWSSAQTVSGLFIAFTAPLLGAWADASGRKMPWFWGFTGLAVICAAALWGLHPDGTGLMLALIAFWVGFTASESAFNLNNATLPSLGTPEEVGRISGSASAFGYWGGVVSLFLMLLFFAETTTGTTLIGLAPAFGLDPETREGTRFVGPFIALWFALFMVPFFLWNRDPKGVRQERPGTGQILRGLRASLRDMAERPSYRSFLLSSMLYRDSLAALYAYGGIYARLVLGWEITQIGVFGIIAAIAAAVLSWAGGIADQRFGPKPVILTSIWLLILVGIVIIGMSRDHILFVTLPEGSALPDIVFYLCGAIIGGAGGALYSASRSMMVRHTDRDRAAEAFGLFALTGKATAFLAPALITFFTLWTQSNQFGFLPVIFLFLGGLVLLRWVQPDGDRAA
ncbi:MFS transporter [Salipiger sp. P9]|uniref:MFS transporter n=1 Tax=Salipiger pentaromativorans TaxID=2943193 RepID=UPI002157EC7E|nr:MFS transporter [Salipiger pentaromativorans]MCR8548290.1 MFS transporter [Salipiger pentaromativorans]